MERIKKKGNIKIVVILEILQLTSLSSNVLKAYQEISLKRVFENLKTIVLMTKTVTKRF